MLPPISVSFVLFGALLSGASSDRMPPNVNPTHYQQVNDPQYHAPPPPPPAQQRMQPPPAQQHMQPPPPQAVQQHMQPPPPNPQMAAHGGAGGHHHGGGGRLLDKEHIESQKDDIGHHFDMPVDTSKMSEQELQFHYFKMHDADNNNMLDGLELVKSLIHWHDPQNHDPHTGVPPPEAKIFPDSELENMIDPILKADDRNGDGFIDYLEFVKAQEAAAAAAANQQQQQPPQQQQQQQQQQQRH